MMTKPKHWSTTRKNNNQKNVIYVDLSAVKGNKIIAKGSLSFDGQWQGTILHARRMEMLKHTLNIHTQNAIKINLFSMKFHTKFRQMNTTN